MNVSFENKSVIITGATSGIGRGMALLFAKNSASVVVNGNNEERGNAVVSEIRAAGGKAVFVRANVGDPEDARKLAEATVAEYGKIDVLINNAGINIDVKDRGPIHKFPDEMWRKIMNVDLDGVYNCSKAVLAFMTERRYGKIINIGSIVGLVPLRNQCAFAAAKAAVNNLTKAMAIELAESNINVNAILPGSIQIPKMVEGGMYTDGRYESIMSHIPFHRPGSPDDIGYGAMYLASDAANYVTGNILVIDGGWTCGFARDW